MLKYHAVALALKLFSTSTQTEKIYRFLGNKKGIKKRLSSGLPTQYFRRAEKILNTFEKYNIGKKNNNFLELGTGWVHWESIILSLIYQGHFTVFDVWDCRQLQALQTYLQQLNLRKIIKNQDLLHTAQNTRLNILNSTSFEQIYKRNNFEYVVNPSGKLNQLAENHYDVCYSYNVLEHIHKDILVENLKSLYKLLKPGGYSVHLIDLSDHLSHYDSKACGKNYLRYSDSVWNTLFQNTVQYFNRIQRSEWLDLFQKSGFKLIDEEYQGHEMGIQVAPQYQHLDSEELNCTSIYLIHQKPMN